MKRKNTGKDPKVVAEEMAVGAYQPAAVTASKRKDKCEVCASPVAPNCSEALCWVCRRLKISAWRDSDLQAAAPE